jgi:ribosomal-protein-alanine N-acetyltransferase
VQTWLARLTVPGETVNRQDSSARSGVIPALNTAHLLLHPFRPEDAAPLYQILAQPGLLQYFPDPTPPSLERVERFIGMQLAQWQERGYALWAVQPLQTDRLAGWCGPQFLSETGETEVAYLLGREWWGRGYATEAACVSLDFTFRQFPLDQIIALVHPDNAASICVIEKLGMKSTGLAPYFGVELERFVLTRSAWQEQIEKK